MNKRTKKADKVSTSSVFWKPTETGEVLEGTFQGFEQMKDLNGHDAAAMKVGDRKVNISASLKSLFAEVYGKLKAGSSKVRLVYLGTSKVKSHKGWTVKVFNLYVDGKQVETKAGTPATKSYLDDFFGSKAPKSGGKK